MLISGTDALEHTFKAGTAYTTSEIAFEEMEACVEMGIKYTDYLDFPGTYTWLTSEHKLSKSDVIMWYRYHKIVPAALEDIAARRSGNR